MLLSWLAVRMVMALVVNLQLHKIIIMSSQALARAQSTVSLRRRVVRTSSDDRNSQLKKSSTAASFRPKLERLIQEGRIEHLMNQDASSKNNLLYTNHVNDLDKELVSTKKSLSTFVVKSRQKEQSINAIKNSIARVERESEIIRGEARAAANKHGNTSDHLSSKRGEQEVIFWEEKKFSHLRDRGYKDEVYLRSRYEALQRLHDVESDNRRLLENKFHELRQANKELRRYRGQADRIAKEQAVDKNEFIGLLEKDMSERDQMGGLRAEKYRREGQINDIAPSLIEREELEKILEVLNAHRVLWEIIKVKSNNLIQRYATVNKAYNFIKSNSNIPEPQKILTRMEEHDKLYDDALKRVTVLEAQLAAIENGFQNVAISKNEILSLEGQDTHLPPDYYQGLERDRYELLVSQKQKLGQRNSEDEVLRLNIQQWGSRMFKRFGITQNESNSFIDCLTDLVVKIRQQK